jgi:O-antigen/teichoic acid export membrane protein
VRFSFVGVAARLPEGRLSARAAPVAEALDSILYDHDDRAVSRRIALTAFIVRIFSAVIAYFSQVLLARWMGDFEYGIFVVVWVGAVILGGLACLGFQTAILRFVPEYSERGEAQLLRGVVLGSRIQGFVAATLFAVIGAVGLYAFGDQLSSYYLIPLYLGAITLPMLAIGEIHDGMSRAFNWADLSLWPTFIIRPILIILFMWFAVQYDAVPNAVTAMAAVIAATYLTSIGQLVWLDRRIRAVVPSGPRDYQPRTWAAIALPIFIVEGFFNLLTNVDIIIVGHFMAPDQVAIYFAAAKTLALVHFVYFSVRAGGAQRFAQYYASGDRARLEAFLRDTLHWTF